MYDELEKKPYADTIPGGTQYNHEKSKSRQPVSRTRFKPSTSQIPV